MPEPFIAVNRKDFEIMAPVGSFESLHAAINAGTDAIYFGVGDLNMRARSSVNFTLDDLRDIAATCHAAGVRTYLTLNTVLYDDELDRCREIVRTARDAGISAVIASDIAAITIARSEGMEVHISTQCNITNIAAVRFYAQWADVMVLARELNLDQVKHIHEAIVSENICGPSGRRVKIEMFCHGALCMAVSGKCYLSLHQMNSSANRGSCTQICRRSYDVIDRETGDVLNVDNERIMSPKDLKTIHFLNKMIDAGVEVFKIEGRARGPEYVDNTVRCYSEALDAIATGTYSDEKIAAWDARLRRVFNRDFWDGYYLGQRLGEWSHKYGSSATHTKVYVAKVTRWFPKLGVAEFHAETGELHRGDTVLIIGPTTGVVEIKLDEMRLDAGPVDTVVKGNDFSIAVPCKIRTSDRLYLWKPIAEDRQ